MKTSHQYPEHVVRRALGDELGSVPLGHFEPNKRGFEAGLLDLIVGLTEYAGAHVRQYDSPIADDGVLGEAWLDALRGVRALLNGELGRLDGGTLDHAIIELYKAAGFEGDEP